MVITGKGRGFCSGGDVEGIIAELFARDTGPARVHPRDRRAHARHLRCRRPVIAAVNGVAVGAGAVIAAACDLRIASESAKIGFIFPKVGLSGADMGASFLLPRIVGRGRAASSSSSATSCGAEAQRIGLVNRVVPEDEVLAVATVLAERLARGPAFAHTSDQEDLMLEAAMAVGRRSRPRRGPGRLHGAPRFPRRLRGPGEARAELQAEASRG